MGGYLTSVNRRYAFAASAAMVLVGWGVVGTQVKETLPPEKRKKTTGSESKSDESASTSSKSSSTDSGFSVFTLSDSHPLSFLRLMGPQATPQMRTLTWLHALGGMFVTCPVELLYVCRQHRAYLLVCIFSGIPEQAFITFQFAMKEKLNWGADNMGAYLSSYGAFAL